VRPWLVCCLIQIGIAHGSILVIGQLPTLLSSAEITIPANPSAATVTQISQSNYYEHSFVFTVTGGVGNGSMLFDGGAYATLGNVSQTSEYMSSSSAIGAPFSLSSLGLIGFQGSDTQLCTGVCNIPFTFGVPETVTFKSGSSVSYSFGPMVPGVGPAIFGQITAYARLNGISRIYSAGSEAFLTDAIVTVQDAAPVPEPRTWWLVAAGFIATLWFNRKAAAARR